METQVNRRSVLAALVSSVCLFRSSAPNSHQRADEPKQKYTLRKFTAPFYPVMARQVGIEGKAALVAHLSKEGRVSAVTNVSGNPLFQSAVSEAVKEWRFDRLIDEVGQLTITFQFLLKGEPDQRIVNYKVSGTLPDYFEIEANPFGANP